MIRRLVLKADVRREYVKLRAEHPAKQALSIARYNCKMRASPFYRVNDGEQIEYKGRTFTVRIERDDFVDTPWDHSEPLAPVRESRYSAYHEAQLSAGNVWLNGAPDSHTRGYIYERAAAIAAVRKWGKDYNEERAARIVDAEIERFGRWLRDDWFFASIGLELDGDSEYVGGVESDCDEYIAELLEEHAGELIERAYSKQRRAELVRCFC